MEGVQSLPDLEPRRHATWLGAIEISRLLLLVLAARNLGDDAGPTPCCQNV
jgi:hypothetical protein